MSSKKRTSDDTESESIASQPPKKKQKTDSDLPKDEIRVIMSTQLGKSEKSFDSNDLRLIDYFENLYSGRWNADKACTVENQDISCSIKEIEALIHFKKNTQINTQYPFDRLVYLCSASDYFVQPIDTNTFQTYFANCIPAIQFTDLVALKAQCHSMESCSNLCDAIEKTIKQIHTQKNMLNQKLIKHWDTVPLQLITSNVDVASQIFMQNMKFVVVGSGHHYYGGQVRREFAFLERSAADLSTLWRYLCDNKAYLKYTKLLVPIQTLTVQASYSSYHSTKETKDIAKVMTRIVQDVLQLDIIYTNKSVDVTQERNYQTICRIFDVQKAWENDYSYLFAIMMTLVQLRSSKATYHTYFNQDVICKLLNEKMPLTFKSAKPIDVIKGIEALKVNERFRKCEHIAILKVILDYDSSRHNATKTNEYKGKMQSMMKKLIESDYNKTFTMADRWFPILMIDYKDWIIDELPKVIPLKSLQILISGICEYITSKAYKAQGCDKAYFGFINKYTNTQWDVPQNDS
eukprot:469078_1